MAFIGLLLVREFVFDILWRIKVPKKVKFFTWKVLLGHMTTLDWLFKKVAFASWPLLLYPLLESGGRPGPIALGL